MNAQHEGGESAGAGSRDRAVVVVRTRGRWPMLERSLRSVTKQEMRLIGAVLICVARGCRLEVEGLGTSLQARLPPGVWVTVMEDEPEGLSTSAIRWLKVQTQLRWIAFLDDDDEWPRDHLERMILGLEEGRVAVAPFCLVPEWVGIQQPAIQSDARWALERPTPGVWGECAPPLSCWVGCRHVTLQWLMAGESAVAAWARVLWAAVGDVGRWVRPSVQEVRVSVRRWVPPESIYAHRQRRGGGPGSLRLSDWPDEGEEVETCKLSMKAVMPWPAAPPKPWWMLPWWERRLRATKARGLSVADDPGERRALIDQIPVSIHHCADPAFLVSVDLCREECLHAFGEVFESADHQRMHQLGYELGGVAAVGFVEWAWRQCRARKRRRVCFLGRDGFLFYEVARRLFVSWPGELEAVYLPVSRRLFEAAAMVEWTAGRLDRICTPARGATIGEWLERLGLTWAEAEGCAAEVGWREGRERLLSALAEPAERSAVKRRLKMLAEALRERIGVAAAEAQERLDTYLRGRGLRSSEDCIVDLGWMGTSANALQRAVRRMEGPTAELIAFYFGHWAGDETMRSEGGRLEAWFFDRAPFLAVKGLTVPMERHQIVLESVALLEMLFSSTEGSVVGLERKDGGEIGLLSAEPEFTGIQAELLSQFHAAALRFADHFGTRHPLPPDGSQLGYYVENALRRLLSQPTAAEGRMFGQFFPLEQHASAGARRTLCCVPDLPEARWARHGVLNAAYADCLWRKGFRAQLSAADLELLPKG